MQGYGTFITVTNINVQHSDKKVCSISENITVGEWNYNMDTFYEYGFINTATNVVKWSSIFGTKIILKITKKVITDDKCEKLQYKAIEVSYIVGVKDYLKVKKPFFKHFNYTPAR
jgi:hypothetical protein